MDAGGFGARLRSCRRSARLSQQELAERSGLSVRAISDLERGRTRWPYRDSLQRLADALGLRDAARAGFIGAAGRRLASGGADPAGPNPAGPNPARADAGLDADVGTDDGRGVPRQLPAAVPAFVGRQDQLAALSQVLQLPGGTAVITAIGGTAGVGKTALAVQWAHQVAGQFPDGQLFVNLRGFDPSGPPLQAADAVRMLLDALQIPAEGLPQTAEGQLGLYRSLLAGKRMLVVLDNARDAAQVRPLLPGSPSCRVVVTSRNQLTSLAAIEAAHPLTLDVLTGAEARQLLHERLGPQRLAADPAAVAHIIRSCAHLPLALCIIAARAAMRPDLSLTQIAADLSGEPGLDAFADSGDPAADVRGAFSWSYRQLDDETARVFRLAGLHPGPSLERHALAALAGTTADRAGQALAALARAGMIQPAGPGQYGLHDLLRSYARELAGSRHDEPERRAMLTRLFDYYLYTAATAMDAAFPAERHRRPPRIPAPPAAVPEFPGAAEALAWLDAERPSLVAVTVHCATRDGAGGETDASGASGIWLGHAIQMAAMLFRYLDTRALFADSVTIHGHACSAARRTGDQVAEATARHNLGSVDLRQGRYQQGAEHLRRSLALHRELGDRPGEARALANLGIASLLQGHGPQAIEDFQRSLALHRELGDRPGEARALGNLGFADLRQGRYRQATGHLRQSLALCREIRDPGGEARALANLGEVGLRQGRYQQAEEDIRQALALGRQLGDRSMEADTLASLGILQLRLGNYRDSASHLHQALALTRATGDMSRQALALIGIGESLLATGRFAAARRQYAAALDVAAQVGDAYEQARAHDGMARAYQASGVPARARRHRQKALALFSELGAPEADQLRDQLAQAAAAAGR